MYGARRVHINKSFVLIYEIINNRILSLDYNPQIRLNLIKQKFNLIKENPEYRIYISKNKISKSYINGYEVIIYEK